MDTLTVYMPMDRRRPLTIGGALPDRAEGSALFADISGLMPLAETLPCPPRPAQSGHVASGF
jgi:hypothetical protein